MDDDRIERLLKGYGLPDVSPDLDRRVLKKAAAILGRARTRGTFEAVGRDVLHRLGFGYLVWLIDLATATDVEYRVEFI
jgi:hypothetical protein